MRLLFLADVDGTLLVNGRVSEEDAAAIRRWRRRGNQFGLVTGRDEMFCRRLSGQMGVEPDCLICDNGARTIVGEKTIFEMMIPSWQVQELLPFLEEFQDHLMPFVTMPDGQHYFPVRRFGKGRMDYVKEVQADLKYFADEDLEDMLAAVDDVPSLSLYIYEDDRLPSILTLLQQAAPQWKWHQTSHDYIEASLADKAQALTVLLEETAPEGVSYIGDGPNDLPVFHLLHDTWCMSTAQPHVQASAAHIVDSAAQALERKMQYV